MSKTAIIKMRVTPDEKAAAEAIAKARGATISDLLRAYLARVVARSSRKDGAA